MMANDVIFLEWVRQNASEVKDSDLLVYDKNVYNETDLYAFYLTLKVTEADIRGYDSFFTIELRRKNHLTLQEVIDYVAKDIVDTACVIKIRHKNWNGAQDVSGVDITYENVNYKPSNAVNGGRASQYLKNNPVSIQKV